MRKLLILFCVLLSFIADAQNFENVSFEMSKRSAASGSLSKTEAEIAFANSGKMVTHILYPKEIYIINDEYGNSDIYYPETNSLYKTFDINQSTFNTTYYYFLSGETENMGLESAGFLLSDSKIEDMLLVSLWNAPDQIKNKIDFVELVSNGDNPVFMGYLKGESYLKKIYYYGFENFGDFEFPLTMTEINFIEKDSMITKSTFTKFKIDSEKANSLLNFEIPNDAKLIQP